MDRPKLATIAITLPGLGDNAVKIPEELLHPLILGITLHFRLVDREKFGHHVQGLILGQLSQLTPHIVYRSHFAIALC